MRDPGHGASRIRQRYLSIYLSISICMVRFPSVMRQPSLFKHSQPASSLSERMNARTHSPNADSYATAASPAYPPSQFTRRGGEVPTLVSKQQHSENLLGRESDLSNIWCVSLSFFSLR